MLEKLSTLSQIPHHTGDQVSTVGGALKEEKMRIPFGSWKRKKL